MSEDKEGPGDTGGGTEALLLEIVGKRFLSYVLGVDETAVENRLQAGAELDPQREAVLRELLAFLDLQAQALGPEQRSSLPYVLGTLGTYQEQLGHSWATATRESLGGTVGVVPSAEPSQSALVSIAQDVYPLLLLPRSTEEPFGFLAGPSLSSAVFRHPKSKVFEEAVMQDEVLKHLFPGTSEHSGWHGNVYRSTGTGGGIQLSMFASGLLENAWQALSHATSSPEPEEYIRTVLTQYKTARRAVAGKKMTIKALVGVTGLRLPDDLTLDLPWGRLRHATEQDSSLVPPGLGGKLTTTTESGTQIEIDYAGDLVMEMDVPYKIKIGSADETSGWPVELSSQQVLEDRLETLRLALLLSSQRKTAPIVLGTWSAFQDPLAIGGRSSSWRDPRRARALLPVLLTKAEARRWESWIARVDQGRVKNITVAIRRTLFAAADRADPTDALVDAVIAWENLVGSTQGEPTLRISAALAWLLGKNAADRQRIRKQVGDLYALRSQVVHGNRALNPTEANEKHLEALDIAIRALRQMFHRHSYLLTECENSTERSMRLILNNRAGAEGS